MPAADLSALTSIFVVVAVLPEPVVIVISSGTASWAVLSTLWPTNLAIGVVSTAIVVYCLLASEVTSKVRLPVAALMLLEGVADTVDELDVALIARHVLS